MTRKRLLVVEDDTALARVLSDNLSFAGFDGWSDEMHPGVGLGVSVGRGVALGSGVAAT